MENTFTLIVFMKQQTGPDVEEDFRPEQNLEMI
jgi:hypothetical protein